MPGSGRSARRGNIKCRAPSQRSSLMPTRWRSTRACTRKMSPSGRSTIWPFDVRPLMRISICYFHRSILGHEIKSRANHNFIYYNLIADSADGDGSYSINLPNGAESYVIGNAIEKGPKTENSTVIDYGSEGLINGDSLLY